MLRYLYLLLTCGLLAPQTVAASEWDSVADILSRRCLSCHDDVQADGGISLENPRVLLEEEIVLPGEAESSYLLELITPIDGSAEMPKDADPLAEAERETIRQWITAGATLPESARLSPPKVADLDWWSLQPIPTAPTPLTPSAVDGMIDQALAARQLTPFPEADARTLVRRLYYDLTGLPPGPTEVESFVADYTGNPEPTWRALVDRLLDSPEFGEKWAQHWLDLARYAETHGYDKDKPREHAWPYRDYVIRSFNQDRPLTDFVRQQIAGDVLPEAGADGIVATGFLAAGPWDFIGHVEVGEGKLDGRIAKHLDRDEMASAVFNVFQSTTIQCAQCHHHKFDPIRSDDYYRVQAVFAAIDRADRIYTGRSTAQQQRFEQLSGDIQNLEAERKALVQARQSKLASYLEPLEQQIAKLRGDHPLTAPPEHGYHSLFEPTPQATKWIQLTWDQPQTIDAVELIACFDNFNQIGEGFGFPQRFHVEVGLANERDAGESSVLRIHDATAQPFPNPGATPVRMELPSQPIRWLRVTATELAPRQNDYIFALGEIRALAANNNLATGATVSFSDSIAANPRWNPDYVVDDRYYGKGIPREALVRLADLSARRSKIEAAHPPAPRIAEIDSELQTLRRDRNAIPPGEMVYAAATNFTAAGGFQPRNGKPREIYTLHRGDLRSPGERALPGAPPLWSDAPGQFVDSTDYDEGRARLALANYITHQNNPLLWRSFANRLWQWTFGKPLVGTPNDFGRMGQLPTQPELLDHLAASLRDDPQHSMKSIVRSLLLTKTYRRASRADSADTREQLQANRAIDGNNDFYWRATRRRLTAEEFRDTVLAISGVLRLESRGGPSFRDFVLERPQHSPHYEYQLHDPLDPQSHRRSIYRFVVRSQPQPMLTTLDCADPSISTPRRDESTTALQALTQWNSRIVAAMADTWAARLEREYPADAPAQIELACQLAWGRPPTPDESATLGHVWRASGPATGCRVILNTSALMYLD